MKHYTDAEWRAFKQGEPDAPTVAAMEDHLLRCQDCMTRFLNLIDEAEIARAGRFVPSDFSDRTMKALQKLQVRKEPPASRRGKKRRLFAYYAAASIVTLFLASQGFFQAVAQATAKIPAVDFSIRAEASRSLLFNWPDTLTEKSGFLMDRVFSSNSIKTEEVGR